MCKVRDLVCKVRDLVCKVRRVAVICIKFKRLLEIGLLLLLLCVKYGLKVFKVRFLVC